MGLLNIFDLDGDGVLNEDEAKLYRKRLRVQRRIAILSFVAILLMGFGIVIFTGFEFITIEMVEGFSTFLGWFFTILGGIVLAYMGIEASSLLNKK